MADRVVHPIPPVWDKNSRVLVLGSFPSVRSREQGFFYGHPQNRFWRVLAALYGQPLPAGIDEKRALLLSHGVALWDVVESCGITGSADASIRDPQPNDISVILRNSRVARVFTNGATAGALYRKYILPVCGTEATVLPSTSPANAACSLEALTLAWRVILPPAED